MNGNQRKCSWQDVTKTKKWKELAGGGLGTRCRGKLYFGHACFLNTRFYFMHGDLTLFFNGDRKIGRNVVSCQPNEKNNEGDVKETEGKEAAEQNYFYDIAKTCNDAAKNVKRKRGVRFNSLTGRRSSRRDVVRLPRRKFILVCRIKEARHRGRTEAVKRLTLWTHGLFCHLIHWPVILLAFLTPCFFPRLIKRVIPTCSTHGHLLSMSKTF